jgi:hypothetical protein
MINSYYKAIMITENFEYLDHSGRQEKKRITT